MKHLIPEFERWFRRYPAEFRSSLVIPCLHRIQQDRGYIDDSDIDGLVEYLGVPRIQIEEVLSFYTMFRRKPIGRHHLEVCRNVSCSLRGAERVIGHLQDRLGVKTGETTPDGRVTLATCECMGSCGTAPMMVVNGKYHENLTLEEVDRILGGLD